MQHRAHVSSRGGRCAALYQLLEMEHVVVLVSGHVLCTTFLSEAAGPLRPPEALTAEPAAASVQALIKAVLAHTEDILEVPQDENRPSP